jgi:hypothetical protein
MPVGPEPDRPREQQRPAQRHLGNLVIVPQAIGWLSDGFRSAYGVGAAG